MENGFSFEEFSHVVRYLISRYAYEHKTLTIDRRKVVIMTWLTRQLFIGGNDKVLKCFEPIMTKWDIGTKNMNLDYNLIQQSMFNPSDYDKGNWILIPLGDRFIIKCRHDNLFDMLREEEAVAMTHIHFYIGPNGAEQFLNACDKLTQVESSVVVNKIRKNLPELTNGTTYEVDDVDIALSKLLEVFVV